MKMHPLMILSRAILPARAVTFATGYKQTVGGHVQKAVLLAYATLEGQPTPLRIVAGMAGCSESAAHRAVQCLCEQGLIAAVGPVPASRSRPALFTVCWPALVLRVPTDTPPALLVPPQPPIRRSA